MNPPIQYDVFLSHNGLDKSAVESLARRLEAVGIHPFLDKWHLIPGQPWQEALEEALEASTTCAVFLGPGGTGTWQNEEMRTVLDARLHQKDFRVVPVLLPGSDLPERARLPYFLSRLTWVDFRAGLQDEEAFRRLVAGIRGAAPGSGSLLAGAYSGISPYRGLEKFRPQDAEWFFGRDSDIQQLIEKLRSSRFLAILGASGSGKSSMALAGLLPRLQGGILPGSHAWLTKDFVPTAQPLEALAVALAGMLPGHTVGSFLRELEGDMRALHMITRQLLSAAPASSRLVLVVDQFEEAFTLCQDEKARKAFFGNLLYASGAPGGQTIIVVTMRVDFLSKCAAYPELADQLAAQPFLVTSLDEHQLRQAIETPAARAGLQFEPGMIERILDDVAGQEGGLPLLQHALFELWKRRDGDRLTYAAYHEIGGVTGALARTADAIYEQMSKEQQVIAQRVLLNLVVPGEGAQDTSRQANYGELITHPEENQVVEGVLQRLADARLVTADQNWVSLAHEALMISWPKYQAWINEHRDDLRTHRRLNEATEEWQRLGQDEGALYRGAHLEGALEWAAGHPWQMSSAQKAFLTASRELRDRDQAREVAQRQRELEVAQSLAAAAGRLRQRARLLAMALFVAIALAVAASWQFIEANRQRTVAESEAGARATEVVVRETAQALAEGKEHARATQQAIAEMEAVARATQQAIAETSARRARSGELAAQAEISLNSYPERSLLLAVEAVQASNPTILLVQQALVLALGEAGGKPFTGHKDQVTSLVISPDGHWLASASLDSSTRLWNLSAPDPSAGSLLLAGHEDSVNALAVSPDYRWLASGSSDHTVLLWDLTQISLTSLDPKLTPLVLEGHDGSITGLAISPDGHWLASASWDKTIRLWDLSAPNPSASAVLLKGHKDIVTMVAISPDGHWLVSGSWDGELRLWDLTSPDAGANPLALQGHTGSITSLAISPDGRWLVSGSADNNVCLWDLASAARQSSPILLTGHQDRVATLAISADSHWLASGSWDSTVRLWDLTAPDPNASPVILEGHKEMVVTLAFSPDMRWLASGSWDSTIRLWDLTSPDPGASPLVLIGHDAGISALAISADGRWLVSGGRDTTIRLWPLYLEDQITLACQEAGRNLSQEEWLRYFPGETYRQTCPQWP